MRAFFFVVHATLSNPALEEKIIEKHKELEMIMIDEDGQLVIFIIQ